MAKRATLLVVTGSVYTIPKRRRYKRLAFAGVALTIAGLVAIVLGYS